MASLSIKAIEEIGSTNVVQIANNNDSNYKVVGGIIKRKYPHIFWTPWMVHSMSLPLKRMSEPSKNLEKYAQSV